MKATYERLVDLSRRAAVAAHVDRLDSNQATSSKRGKSILIVQTLLMLLIVAAPMAMAQQSLGDSADKAGQSLDQLKSLIAKAGIVGGALAMLVAGAKMRQRSTEGENSQVKMGMIIGLFFAGIIFAGGGALLLRAGASVGLQSSDYGTVPGN